MLGDPKLIAKVRGETALRPAALEEPKESHGPNYLHVVETRRSRLACKHLEIASKRIEWQNRDKINDEPSAQIDRADSPRISDFV